MTRKPGNRGLQGRLLNSSIDAYVLALETINRLSVRYRIEAFAFLICNAWELLLKAKLIDDRRDTKCIYYKKKKGEDQRSLSLNDCLSRIFPDERDPVRKNIEYVADIRHRAVHLVIGQVPKDVLSLFQACVLNYHRLLHEWFEVSLSDRVPVGMMTLVYDFAPDQFDLQSPVLRRRLGRDTALYLADFQSRVQQEAESLGRPSQFSITIDYRLALVKKVGEGDIVLYKGDAGEPGRVVVVPKDPGHTHPYRRTEVVQEVNGRLSGLVQISGYDIQCVVSAFGIRGRSDYYYQGSVPNSPVQYSREFVDFILERFRSDSGFFESARARVRASRPSKK